MARVRSPNYPAFSLPEAIARVKLIHTQEQHLAAPKEVIAKHLGYGGMNGASIKALSAIMKYGLLEEISGDKIRVSPLAISILYPAKPEEKASAIREAAFKPPLFTEIFSEWDGAQPSDQNLKSWLIRRQFGADALDRVIQSYRETMELVTRESGAYPPPTAGADAPGEEQTPMTPQVQSAPATGSPKPPGDDFVRMIKDMLPNPELNKFRIVDHGAAIEVQGLVDRKGLEKLLKRLTAYKAVLDANAEDEDPEMEDMLK